jgi:hypothetical protein
MKVEIPSKKQAYMTSPGIVFSVLAITLIPAPYIILTDGRMVPGSDQANLGITKEISCNRPCLLALDLHFRGQNWPLRELPNLLAGRPYCSRFPLEGFLLDSDALNPP